MARRLVLGLTLALTLALAAPAAGDDVYGQKSSIDAKIARLREQVARANARERELSAQIAEVSARIRTLEHEVGDVSVRLDSLERDLALQEEKLDRITELFRLQTRRLEFLRRQYAAAVERLNHRLVEIYESDELDALDVALSATSFADLIEQLDYFKQIGRQDERIAREVGIAKAEVRAARARTARTRERVAAATRTIAVRADQVRAVRDRLVASRQELAGARSRKRETLSDVTESEREYVSEAEALSKVSAQLAARIQAAQAKAASTTPSSAPSASGFVWPVSGPVVSPFGMRWGRLHEGIDIAAPTGVPIAAAAAGTVIYAGWIDGYGNIVVLDHGGGLATAYAHESSVTVSEGEQVAQGQTVGYVGCTGHCFGPHLHFEVRVNGAAVDPLGYL